MTDRGPHGRSPATPLGIPAGQEHYHGATSTTAMAHLSILTPGRERICDDDIRWPPEGLPPAPDHRGGGTS